MKISNHGRVDPCGMPHIGSRRTGLRAVEGSEGTERGAIHD